MYSSLAPKSFINFQERIAPSDMQVCHLCLGSGCHLLELAGLYDGVGVCANQSSTVSSDGIREFDNTKWSRALVLNGA